MLRKFFILAVLLILTSCSSYAPEELDRLTKEDPNFKQMILTRDQMHQQIRLIKDDLLSRKKAMDTQIDRLRQEYDGYAKAQNLKIEKYKSTIEADRNLLRREIEAHEAHLTAKLTELGGYQKTLSDVRKVLRESKGIQLSSQENEKWNERILMLSEKIRPLLEEIQELKLQVRLKKQKMSFLK